MKFDEARLARFFSRLGNRLNLLYILASVPLLLILYYDLFSVVIPFYAFLFLLLKREKLLHVKEANSVQKILASVMIVGSFFVYYGVVLVYPRAAFYTAANYVVYLLGLFLLFFEFSALREAFTPLFLIVAATSSSFIAAYLKPFLSPFANDFAHIIANILRVLGVDATIYHSRYNTPVIAFTSLSGTTVRGAFVYECIGVYSALVFSIILVVILFEDRSSLRVKLAYSSLGILGTFALNILRVTIILLADYFYGAEVGGTIHYVIGYTLFSAWLAGFFYTYSKRQTLHAKIKAFWKRITRADSLMCIGFDVDKRTVQSATTLY